MNEKQLLNELSNQEKAKLFVGKSFWEIEKISNKNLFLSDGPHGIRKEEFINGKKKTVKAICYPSAVLSSCSFNKKLLYELGEELAKECIHFNIDILLGPGVNIKRNPLCGRNFEYFSEDPFLAGKLASEYINGVQSKNVGVSLKHFAVNSQEFARFVNDSIVDERALREIYLKAFEIAIKESNPWTIMASYNKVNGFHATENYHLLTQIGREEFKFQGAYISDWGAVCNPVLSLKNGLNLEMPGTNKSSSRMIIEAINKNDLSINELDASTLKLIELYQKTKKLKVDEYHVEEGLKLCKKINDESIVLLKNQSILPLNLNQSIALIGEFSLNPHYQGSGSSQINSIYVDNLYTEFKNSGINFSYAQGYSSKSLKPNKKLINQAIKIAKENDVVIIVCGLPPLLESEGYDRDDLNLPKGQIKLIEELVKVNKNIVVILQNGSPVSLPFIDSIKGLIEAYLGGSKGAESLKDILYGKVNPSGRLTETFPVEYKDVVSKNNFANNSHYTLYKESIFVGYRYYNTFNKKVLFPFGYGLSYSDVSYSNLQVKKLDDGIDIKVTVKNNSNIPCKEVVQIYIGMINSKVFRAKKELKCFEKIQLESNEEKMIHFTLPIDNLKYYSINKKCYLLEKGIYRVYASKHVNDDNLYEDLSIDSNDLINEEFPSIYLKMDKEITNHEFEQLLDRKLDLSYPKKPYNKESTINELSKSLLGFIAFKIAIIFKVLSIKDKEERKMISRSIPNQPIRSIEMLGGLNKEQVDGIVDIMNLHFIRGIKKLRMKEKNND